MLFYKVTTRYVFLAQEKQRVILLLLQKVMILHILVMRFPQH